MLVRRGSFVPVVLAALLVPSVARAQFATTNVEALYGWTFEDSLLGFATADRQMGTLTVNHFSTWKYGDNFVFVDMYRGDFQTGWESTVYAEWHPRLLITRLLDWKGRFLGVFSDFGAAFEVNEGPAFYAYMAGVGGNIALPFPGSLGINVFYRRDSVQVPGPDIVGNTWQVSPYWGLPFSVGPVSLLFAGFVDLAGANDNEDVDVIAQPQLLVDVLALGGGAEGRLYAGLEWFLHYNPLIRPETLVSSPQVMAQWVLH